MPGLAPSLGPPFATPPAPPAPPAPPRPREPPDRSIPALHDVVAVPAGVYTVGEPGEERRVELAGFAIGRFPVTNAHVKAFVDETGHALSGARLEDPQLADHPATELTFADALAFCAWADARLPTGDEWEAAARGHDDGAAENGAQQLAGNVWEWVGDPPDEDGWRTVRGGSYLDHAWGVRTSRALSADPARATPTTGFRIAKDRQDRPPRRTTP
jgi:formylglycine-generating enzyme required for sulfatase activity